MSEDKEMARFFDYESVAAEAGICQSDLDALRSRFQADYPGDELMCELRLLRVCHAVGSGRCTVAEALRPEGPRRDTPAPHA
jgi:hypothetical protein